VNESPARNRRPRAIDPSRPSTWRGGLVYIPNDGDVWRPAAFVWLDSAGGVTWLEPSYADPWGASSPALHRRECGARAKPYDPEQDNGRDPHGVGDALTWFARWLQGQGRTWAQERAKMARVVAREYGKDCFK
jgi:hypothetical protein